MRSLVCNGLSFPPARILDPVELPSLRHSVGHVLWLTGLSGSGKTTLASTIYRDLILRDTPTILLDGDTLRLGLNRDLGFSDTDRAENVRRISEVARLVADAGLLAIVACISPFNKDRLASRDVIGSERFTEVFVDAPLAVCRERDPKGLYSRAQKGLLPQMTGVDSPYEAPTAPDLHIRTDLEKPTASAMTVLIFLEQHGFVERSGHGR